jgi:hypothetical protein
MKKNIGAPTASKPFRTVEVIGPLLFVDWTGPSDLVGAGDSFRQDEAPMLSRIRAIVLKSGEFSYPTVLGLE